MLVALGARRGASRSPSRRRSRVALGAALVVRRARRTWDAWSKSGVGSYMSRWHSQQDVLRSSGMLRWWHTAQEASPPVLSTWPAWSNRTSVPSRFPSIIRSGVALASLGAGSAEPGESEDLALVRRRGQARGLRPCATARPACGPARHPAPEGRRPPPPPRRSPPASIAAAPPVRSAAARAAWPGRNWDSSGRATAPPSS